MEPASLSAYERLLAEMHEEFPRFKLIDKGASRFQHLIDRALRILTFGQMQSYLDGYHTTLGQRVYVPAGWSAKDERAKYVVLCHERVHMRQFRRFSFVGMTLLYLLLPLPMGLAYFRARFEMEAYAESIRAACEIYGAEHVRSASYRRYILEQFTGASYGWMWPFPKALDRWYDEELRRVGAA